MSFRTVFDYGCIFDVNTDAVGEKPEFRKMLEEEDSDISDQEDEEEDHRTSHTHQTTENREVRSLLVSAHDRVLDEQKQGGVASGGASSGIASFPMTLILADVCAEVEESKKFHDHSCGPYFSDMETGLFTHPEGTPVGTPLFLPLKKLVQHVVSTVRVRTVTFSYTNGDSSKSTHGRGRRLLRVKERQFSSAPMTKKRKRGSPSSTTTQNVVFNQKTVFCEYDRVTFCSQRAVRQRPHPVLIVHGNATFLIPLANLVLCIAEEFCLLKCVCTYPMAINRYIPDKMDPLQLYTFPRFAASTFYASQRRISKNLNLKEKDDITPLSKPEEKYYGPLVHHLRDVLCDSDITSYSIIETWLAEMLFSPASKYPICPILSGPMGIGKNMFFDFLTKYVFGQETTASIMHMDQCTGKFNTILKNKILLVINEEDMNKSDRNVQVMKTLCTELYQCLEGKFKEVDTNVEVWARMAILTNNPDPYHDLSEKERRFVVIKTRKEVPSTEYFTRMSALLDHEQNSPIVALHYIGYLRELRRNNYRRCPILKNPSSPSPCTCRVPHLFLHHPPNEYDATKLRRPVVTNYMTGKLLDNMAPLHFFLYAFVVREIPLLSLLPDSVAGNASLLQKVPPHTPLTDLRFVDYTYLYKSYEMYMHYAHAAATVATSVPNEVETSIPVIDSYYQPPSTLPHAKAARGRPKKGGTLSSHMTSGGGASMKQMHRITAFNNLLSDFVGKHNSPIHRRRVPQTLGVRCYADDFVSSESSDGLDVDMRVTHVSLKASPADGKIRKNRFANLSGVVDAFKEKYKQCYAQLPDLFDTAFGFVTSCNDDDDGGVDDEGGGGGGGGVEDDDDDDDDLYEV